MMIDDTTESVNIPDVMTDQDWINIAKLAHSDSTDYLDSGLRKRWERNYSLVLSKHPSGSKYYSDSYKHRSKGFRGKTSAAVRRNLAACAVALFSTQDVVSIKPEDEQDIEAKAAATAIDLLQNYHLTESVPWFRIVNGAYREAMTNGVVFSKQWWEFEEKIVDGEMKTSVDKPVIELIPPENIRISPAADWLDPIGTSPYTIIMIPMFVQDVRARMQLDWQEADDSAISQALGDNEYDSVRSKREADKPDSKAESVSVSDHDVVWVRENFIKHDGEFYTFFTLGDETLLNEPRLVSEAYPHKSDGRPPIIMGVSEIEPFNIYPQSMTERVESLQNKANDLDNQRFDNVTQVLNKRYIVQRGKNVDYRSLTRNIPGSTTLTDDVNAVKEMRSADVTASSFDEQNMLNMDFDELAGVFSTSSVATNRQLNETVGGMQLLSGNANVLTELPLRTFTETWVEPVMREMVNMIKTYEDNNTIAKVTGQNINHAALQAAVNVRVNVGFGATDPQQKVNKLMFGLHTLKSVIPDLHTVVSREEIATEIFGAVGFRDGARFVPGLKEDGDPQVKQLKQQLQQLQQAIKNDQVKSENDMKLAQFKAQAEMEKERSRLQNDREERESRQRIAEFSMNEKLAELAAREDLTLRQMQLQLGIKEMERNTKLQMKDIDARIQERKQADDLKSKLTTQQITGEKGLWPG